MPQRVTPECGLMLLPVEEVRGRGVPPVHVAPLSPVGVVLIVEVVLALMVDEAVGVVHPAVARSEVVGGAVGVGRLLGQAVAEPQPLPAERLLA